MIFDILAVIVVAAMGIAGFREGLLRGGIKLAGFLAGLIAVSMFAGKITGFALGFKDIPSLLSVPAMFLAVMIAINLFFAIIAEVLHRVTHLTPLGVIDSGLGAVFGALKGLFIAGIAALVLSFLPERGFLTREYAASWSAPKLSAMIERIVPAAVSACAGILGDNP